MRYTPGEARPDAVRVLLISSSNGSGWVFPKGGWELDESVIEAARRETVEEGGVRGDLEEPQLGVYPYSNRKPGSQRKGCIAHVFVMNVQEELTVWPEAAHRTRRWVRYPTLCFDMRRAVVAMRISLEYMFVDVHDSNAWACTSCRYLHPAITQLPVLRAHCVHLVLMGM